MLNRRRVQKQGEEECDASTPSPSVVEGNHCGTKPSFFDGNIAARRALQFLKEIMVARTLLFLMENIARRVAMPLCF